MLPEMTCEVCERLIEPGAAYIEDFFGGASHADCLEAVEPDDEEDARDD